VLNRSLLSLHFLGVLGDLAVQMRCILEPFVSLCLGVFVLNRSLLPLHFLGDLAVKLNFSLLFLCVLCASAVYLFCSNYSGSRHKLHSGGLLP